MSGRYCRAAILLALVAAPALLAEEPQFLGRTRQQWIGQLESATRRQRSHAAWAISQMAVEQAEPQNAMVWLNELCLLTESSSPSTRYWGVLGLERFLQKLPPEHPARATALAAVRDLLQDSSPATRLAAAEAIGVAGDPAPAVPVLVKGLSDPQEAIRIQAVAALEKLGEAARPAADSLRAATSDDSEYVKKISARALAKLMTPPK